MQIERQLHGVYGRVIRRKRDCRQQSQKRDNIIIVGHNITVLLQIAQQCVQQTFHVAVVENRTVSNITHTL